MEKIEIIIKQNVTCWEGAPNSSQMGIRWKAIPVFWAARKNKATKINQKIGCFKNCLMELNSKGVSFLVI